MDMVTASELFAEAGLTPDEVYALARWLGDGVSHPVISEELGMNERDTYRLTARARARLRAIGIIPKTPGRGGIRKPTARLPLPRQL